MSELLKIGIDIGGVISRYPFEMRRLIRALVKGGATVYIVTDMNPQDAHNACAENGLLELVGSNYIVSCEWSKHGDLCKTRKIEELGIQFMIDDRPDYVAHGNFVGMQLSPRIDRPYYHLTWINRLTPAVCVPPEEYEAFKKWKENA